MTSDTRGASENHGTIGPVTDLERHLLSDWWKTLFNTLYLKTDGDVVENREATIAEIDSVPTATGLEADLTEPRRRVPIGQNSLLFERLQYRDYTCFDFRSNAGGEPKLLEVNPDLLRDFLEAALRRKGMLHPGAI